MRERGLDAFGQDEVIPLRAVVTGLGADAITLLTFATSQYNPLFEARVRCAPLNHFTGDATCPALPSEGLP